MKIFENEEDVNVCKIWDEIKEDGREEGRKDGRAEEIICFGIEEGWSKEKILSRLQTRLSIESERAEEYYNLYSNKMVTV
jgi:predicted transposase YdaD